MEETDKSIMAFLEDKFKNIENRMIGIDQKKGGRRCEDVIWEEDGKFGIGEGEKGSQAK